MQAKLLLLSVLGLWDAPTAPPGPPLEVACEPPGDRTADRTEAQWGCGYFERCAPSVAEEARRAAIAYWHHHQRAERGHPLISPHRLERALAEAPEDPEQLGIKAGIVRCVRACKLGCSEPSASVAIAHRRGSDCVRAQIELMKPERGLSLNGIGAHHLYDALGPPEPHVWVPLDSLCPYPSFPLCGRIFDPEADGDLEWAPRNHLTNDQDAWYTRYNACVADTSPDDMDDLASIDRCIGELPQPPYGLYSFWLTPRIREVVRAANGQPAARTGWMVPSIRRRPVLDYHEDRVSYF
jgi:hypothetical protein